MRVGLISVGLLRVVLHVMRAVLCEVLREVLRKLSDGPSGEPRTIR